jgi:hypothetical protein
MASLPPATTTTTKLRVELFLEQDDTVHDRAVDHIKVLLSSMWRDDPVTAHPTTSDLFNCRDDKSTPCRATFWMEKIVYPSAYSR